MKYLLGATIALLLGALAISWQNMKQGVRDAPQEEIDRLRKQIAELQREQDNIVLQKKLQEVQSAQPPAMTVASQEEIEAIKAELQASREALAKIESEQTKSDRDKTVAEGEELILEQRKLESKDSELRRARMISDALLMGKVREYVKNDEVEFVIFEVLMPEQVQVGTILAVRRNTGILTQLEVSDITAEGAIANILPGYGAARPQAGDELIIPPPF